MEQFLIENKQIFDTAIQVIEILIALYVVYASIRAKQANLLFRVLAPVFAVGGTGLLTYFEHTHEQSESSVLLLSDELSLIMLCIVIGVGGLITLYAFPYMRDYKHHHPEVKSSYILFFSVIIIFLIAMCGLVTSDNMIWIFFFWEITSLCSFLLIGWTKTKEAVNNSFRALAINLSGGLAFAAAIVLIASKFDTLSLTVFLEKSSENPESLTVSVAAGLLCFAALTKSAQLPFHSWLLGAMVAPTPTSALLHSATMVKAGVYLVIRLAPILGATVVGYSVTVIAGLTFLVTSIIAITQFDGKRILAYSTVANLGLMLACASIGTPESLWAAIFLLIFHAVSKSLLFLCVGATEHKIGNRNVEHMGQLLSTCKPLAICMLIGIAGMFLAPFGMLISKWAAMKAFVDSDNLLIIMILVYGSAATLFYWTKWMGKIVQGSNNAEKTTQKLALLEGSSIYVHAILVTLACFGFPYASKYLVVPYLDNLFGEGATAVISGGNVTLMLVMLSLLLILPLSFVIMSKKDNRKQALVYMSGENIGDNSHFYGAMDSAQENKLRNWYMQDEFSEKRFTLYGNLIVVGIMLCTVVMLLGGGF
ncbi:MAG: NADH-quinone oxidoreductase subunit L [Ruminococcus sp.]|jgi:ech hydrogenase subunit A|nr:NADH-quinone oxidoreductase subunit L [Ruminococcus sp.]